MVQGRRGFWEGKVVMQEGLHLAAPFQFSLFQLYKEFSTACFLTHQVCAAVTSNLPLYSYLQTPHTSSQMIPIICLR